MFQTLTELITYLIHQVIEESEEINEFSAESRPLVCASFMRLYSALRYVECYSQEFNTELHAISKGETPLIKAVIRSKNEKLFASIENFNFQLLNLEYLGDYHINSSLRGERKRKAVWHYPDEWCIDVSSWITRNFITGNFEDCNIQRSEIVKHGYAIFPFVLTSPSVELSKRTAIVRYPTRIPNASMEANIIAKLSVEMVDLKTTHSSSKLSFGQCVCRGRNGAYQHILSGEQSYRLLMQLIHSLLGVQEIDLQSTMLTLLLENTQPNIDSIVSSRQNLGSFIKQSLRLDEILI